MVSSYSRWHGRWNRNKKSGESFLPVQFGGNGGDYAFTMKKISTGILVVGRTYSNTFMGESVDFGPSGTYADFIVLLDSKKFEKKAIYFLSSKTSSYTARSFDSTNFNVVAGSCGYGNDILAVDGDENIYITWIDGVGATAKTIKFDKDLSFISEATTEGATGGSGQYYSKNIYYNNKLYKCNPDFYNTRIGIRGYNLNLTADGTYYLVSREISYPSFLESGGYIFIFGGDYYSSGTRKVAKYNISDGTHTYRELTGFSGSSAQNSKRYSQCIIGDALFLCSGHTTETDMRITKLSTADLSNYGGSWGDRVISVCDLASATIKMDICTVNGRLFYWASGLGSLEGNTFTKCLIGEIDTETGDVISSYAYPMYKDDSKLYQETNLINYISEGKLVEIDTNTVAVLVTTNGVLRGNTNLGDYDCAIVPISVLTGKTTV